MDNTLYYGDNLEVLRESIPDESIDLIYLDPPFTPSVDYNILFKTPTGEAPKAQLDAFVDTWHWSDVSARAFDDVLESGTEVALLLRSLRNFLGDNAMMAYLSNMAVRLIELHRVLSSTGTIYLHCDTTASHYLKILLDGIFGPTNFRNEISWKRSQPKSHAKVNFPNSRDILLRYTKTSKAIFNKIYKEHDPEYIKKFYRFTEPDGRRYRLGDITNPNKNRPNLTYEFLGVTRVWRWTKDRMQEAYDKGIVVQTKPGAVPQGKRYLDEMPGNPITDDWDDIEHLHGSSNESLGYPTQKPLSLLERIINVSSEAEDIVLDPFCGCGTTIHAAEKLNRKWLGIDVTHHAIEIIENRFKEAFNNNNFTVIGRPSDINAAHDLAKRDKYQFQWWATWLIGAQAYRGNKKGSDRGIDGLRFFKNGPKGTGMVIISVKGGENIGPHMIRDLRGVVERESAELGIFVTLTSPTQHMIREAASAGFVNTAHGKFPKIQITTIDDLFNGKMPEVPPSYAVSTIKEVKRKADNKQGEFFFEFPGGKTPDKNITKIENIKSRIS